MKTALITGITGQDGAYLAQHLLNLGYKVYGTYRRSASLNTWRIDELGINECENFKLEAFDMTDLASIISLVDKTKPDEIYNLAAQSFVGLSFTQPIATSEVTAIGVLNLLEAIRIINPKIKFYQAGTSEMYGKVQSIPQDENTPFYPRSPYSVSKLYGHWMSINYRESYDIYASCGILFNHESPLRGKEFVTRKITDMAAKIALKKADCLELGNMDAKRDWGYAKEYVEGMHLILQAKKADTYVLATNRTQSVRDFVKMAFNGVEIDLEFIGEGENEVGIDKKTGKTLVRVNPDFYRPAEVDLLIGDAKKAKNELGWEAKTSLEELCLMMVKADIKRNEIGFCF